jgi:predicted protein tyrosine phosphatase
MAGRAGVNEVLAGRLYQRGKFITWPQRQKREMLKELGVTLVVNLWSKIDSDLEAESVGVTYLNHLASPSHVPAEADVVVEFIASMIKAGHAALIHCEAGRGRSVWLTARVAQALQPERDRAEVAHEVLRAVGSYDVKELLSEDLGLGHKRHKS